MKSMKSNPKPELFGASGFLFANRACRVAFFPRAFLRAVGFVVAASGVCSFDGRGDATGVGSGRDTGMGCSTGVAISVFAFRTRLGDLGPSVLFLFWYGIVFSVPQAEHITHFVVGALPLMRCCRVWRCLSDLAGSHDHPRMRRWLQALQTPCDVAMSTSCRDAESLFVARMKDETVGAATSRPTDAWVRKRRRASAAACAILLIDQDDLLVVFDSIEMSIFTPKIVVM